jgi:hypothetical protein
MYDDPHMPKYTHIQLATYTRKTKQTKHKIDRKTPHQQTTLIITQNQPWYSCTSTNDIQRHQMTSKHKKFNQMPSTVIKTLQITAPLSSNTTNVIKTRKSPHH